MSEHAARLWAEQLGLVATPLFGRERTDDESRHSALLDGVRASFLMSDEGEDESIEVADWAWSANVHHHVSLKQKQIVVSRASGRAETFERRTVESKLAEFLRYLELDSDSQKIVGVIDHLIRLFRRHRATLRESKKAGIVSDLESFLYLL